MLTVKMSGVCVCLCVRVREGERECAMLLFCSKKKIIILM